MSKFTLEFGNWDEALAWAAAITTGVPVTVGTTQEIVVQTEESGPDIDEREELELAAAKKAKAAADKKKKAAAAAAARKKKREEEAAAEEEDDASDDASDDDDAGADADAITLADINKQVDRIRKLGRTATLKIRDELDSMAVTQINKDLKPADFPAFFTFLKGIK